MFPPGTSTVIEKIHKPPQSKNNQHGKNKHQATSRPTSPAT
jgi:hypothetical protein